VDLIQFLSDWLTYAADNVKQGFPTWGTYTPRGTFAHLKGYI